MGFFFRRSSNFGPFRLKFSKSGIGASVGVRGARLTMTPRGTTYVTVGSHGFYYRETLSTSSGGLVPANGPMSIPPTGSGEDAILSAPASDLVDSSSERLVQQLNERANMFNPAWILYFAAAVALGGLAILPPAPTLPNLPDVARPFSGERESNAIDEYSMLTARYGEPSSILYTEADPQAPIPVGTANYNAVHLKVVFAPNGCVGAYENILKSRAEGSRLTKSEMKSATQCVTTPNTGWATVGYLDATQNSEVSADRATAELNTITLRQVSSPIVGFGSSPANTHKPSSRALTKKQQQPRLEMQSNSQSRAAFEQMRRSVEATESRTRYFRYALILGAFGLFVAGVLVHRKNVDKRTSRLFYELDETEQQKYGVVQDALAHLGKSQQVWRIETKAATSDWKRNAGASSLVRRAQIRIGCSSPDRVETNVAVPCLNMGRAKLFFLPDVILFWESGTYGAVGYRDFRIDQSFTRFIEDDSVPADATVVDRTWRYVNKNGGPDRRFNNNIQLPVTQYGVLVLASARGLNIHLNMSNAQESVAVANCWRNLFSRIGNQQDHQPADHRTGDVSSGPRVQALKLLGLNSDATASEISAAYRRLAQMYHPDKVASLAPEFQALADMRMKEINAAYELLKEHGNSA
jgi:Protein of unknown function (DUF4236)/DnaJ domain